MGNRRWWERRLLWAFTYAPIVALIAFTPLAIVWSGGKNFVIAFGLVLEIAGALALVGRPIVEDVGFWAVRQEADARTKPVFYAGAFLLPAGFTLQFVAVVFM
ncbi:MAG: hypothetical protein IH957_02305 [Chloroflexi bacterium]|nr:hypothetical protein [Chloroflexota bacterium]